MGLKRFFSAMHDYVIHVKKFNLTPRLSNVAYGDTTNNHHQTRFWTITLMSLATFLPMPTQSATTPLRHPSHRSPRQKLPSPTFVDKWRDRQRADVIARIKSAREKSATNARGGDDEV